ncbi:1,4-alpha-glucan branching protein GlgB [Paenibacillus glycanilyticus]|uniref:1,4-alpha-glucan branching enzyme GlgB n=1 Tax=Paenibacillus glycanilyticus TaxID=126569 RepID=A0ABQ6G788_9BACL|nr:1,4-alpha-glucan branching protein GlgB [Paenibacillus glycanilyticus]GLX66315.1 1,4-alpha-glucan branching enzyme [Paenibacillus glycanilyticus]
MKRSIKLNADDIYQFHEGTWLESYRKMGAHLTEEKGRSGVRFNVWAPNARRMAIASNCNSWNGFKEVGFELERIGQFGLWSGFLEGFKEGDLYKYDIETKTGSRQLKADPYAIKAEVRPRTASVVGSLEGYEWQDKLWRRRQKPLFNQPLNIYEVHAGTWRRHADGRLYTYEELAEELPAYAADMGYTHIELMPLAEHPYDRSWGYQGTGFYAATSRYGEPQQLMAFVDRCHGLGIGVILDWVPGHFAKDAPGLRQFDGSPLFEHADPLIAEKEQWGTLAFDYEKPEVTGYLISNALFWMDAYHIDGLRVDAVTSMLFRDFDRPEGRWRPNRHGGRENLEAAAFLRKLNAAVLDRFPNALMMAEESHAFPGVTTPAEQGGLGFTHKWNMGWMNDTLNYFALPPEARSGKHGLLTFPIWYAFDERYALPLSHDEVVHGKKSLLDKMPGSYEEKFAGLRLLFGYMMTHPGKKLLFMGGEFGQFIEWRDEAELDWLLLAYEQHGKLQSYVRTLNRLYLEQRSLWQLDSSPKGFEWIDFRDEGQSVIVYRRKGRANGESLIVLCNFHTHAHAGYRVGVPSQGGYKILLNSDSPSYGGAGFMELAAAEGTVVGSEPVIWHGRKHSIEIPLPPLSVVIVKREKESRASVRVETEPLTLHKEAELELPGKRRGRQRERIATVEA